MKTKTFVVLCLFLGIGLTRLSGQDNLNTDYTKSVKEIVVWPGYWQPIVCNGVQIDNLTGTVTVQAVYHYKEGVPEWCNYHTRGEAVSQQTGEIFTVKENDFKQDTEQGEWPRFLTLHFNLAGDMGSHYVGTVTYDLLTNDMSVIKFICGEK